jgi:hypothetical protein
VPGVALHVSQPPLQALLQQNPSTQKPLAHCEAVVQAWPFFLTQEPVAEHVFVDVQLSASSALATVVQVPGVAEQV